MGENTGSIAIPLTEETSKIYGVPSRKSIGPITLTTDTWVKVFLWFLPIAFTAGTMFYSMNNMDSRVNDAEAEVKSMSETQHSVRTEQKIQALKLDTISKAQKEMKEDMKSVDGKLDDQSKDLTLIKEKLRVRE